MKTTKRFFVASSLLIHLTSGSAFADGHSVQVDDATIQAQRATLAAVTEGNFVTPQAPRDIDVKSGTNPVNFLDAPDKSQMNLCNINLRKGAEHRGGEFTRYAGNGDGKGYGTGFLYDGELSEAETSPVSYSIGFGDETRTLVPGDTIEVHYVYTSAQTTPGPTLSACLGGTGAIPQLRIEAQVFVVVNNEKADDFVKLTAVERVNGFHQAVNIPFFTGTPVVYDGSTTGPGYNEKASPFQVTWSVRPEVMKVSARSVANWLADNPFDERGSQGVRNLVTNPALLAPIE
ncbi:MAG: delta-class carbonic anhydrase [Pseudomonadota bacterium]